MRLISTVGLAVLLASCGGTEADPAPTSASPGTVEIQTTTPSPTTAPPTTTTVDADGCAHVVDASIELATDGWVVAATVRSADTGWEKYADAWVVRSPEGDLLGERVLAHPHENEQPFTRSLRGVNIPTGVTVVELAARDSVLGFCGDVFQLEVPPQ